MHLYFNRNGSIEKKKYKNSKIHNDQKRKQKKQTIYIIGYFHNILLSVALQKCSKLYSSSFANKATTQSYLALCDSIPL